jgi:hypothetical protein
MVVIPGYTPATGSIREDYRKTIGRSCSPRQTGGTRIFSPHTVPRLCVSIGRYLNLFKRLTPVRRLSIYRFEHIVTGNSFKAPSKQRLTRESRADAVLGRLAPELEGRWHPRGLVELGADEHHK